MVPNEPKLSGNRLFPSLRNLAYGGLMSKMRIFPFLGLVRAYELSVWFCTLTFLGVDLDFATETRVGVIIKASVIWSNVKQGLSWQLKKVVTWHFNLPDRSPKAGPAL
jgi:hypothetical protein